MERSSNSPNGGEQTDVAQHLLEIGGQITRIDRCHLLDEEQYVLHENDFGEREGQTLELVAQPR
jgi:hypothetical protein